MFDKIREKEIKLEIFKAKLKSYYYHYYRPYFDFVVPNKKNI
jgi:hypothetical protein